MRALIICLFIVVSVLCVESLKDEDVRRQWQEYREKFNKSYRSPVEESTRFAIFCHNLQVIEAHNKLFEEGKTSFKIGINEFTDWSEEEFKEYVSHSLISEKDIIGMLTEDDEVIQSKWAEFQSKYRKSYKSPVETRKRYLIFKNNFIKMQEHNNLFDQGLVSDLLGINQFSDWTQEEFRDFVNKGLIPTEEGSILRRWGDFKRKFNKSYPSITEAEKRFNIFKENVRSIDQHNALYEEGKSTYFMGINQFTDWTNEEYKEWVRTH
ncbi:cysteine proteinase 1-like [Harmonia axyridis]|uniref:cysteine proteinase 1-like n=1 Tax=Harmonia axyridis TaxID=115357 RepID=UPI001E2773D1|nr:cysteine proteinase 1-like [Harmonia axyridis]